MMHPTEVPNDPETASGAKPKSLPDVTGGMGVGAHLSISSDPTLSGAPAGWTLPVREVRASVGAGFIYPLCGEMRTMPGLSASPAATRIYIDENGEVVGLS